MTDCYCDYETPQFIRFADVLARRQHVCCECGCTIRPGETYESAVGKWDGLIDRYKTCPACKELRQWWDANRPCFCWCFGSLHDDIGDDVEHDGHIMLREAPGLLFELGRKVVAIQRRAKADRAARRRT